MLKNRRNILFLIYIFLGINLYPATYDGIEIAPKEKVTLNYRQTPLIDVLKSISRAYNLNIVLSDKIAGTVTVNLNNVPLDDALEVILKVNGYTYMNRGQILEVLDIDSAKQRMILGEDERRSYKTYKLGLVSATDFSEKIKKVLNEEDKILVDKDKNQLIVFARSREMLLIDSILADYREEIKSDRNVELIRTMFLSPEEVVNILSEMGYSISGDVRVSNSLNGILVIAGRDEVQKLKNVVGKIDVPKLQVTIEVRIVEINESFGKETGVSGWTVTDQAGDSSNDGFMKLLAAGFLSGGTLSDGISFEGVLGEDQFNGIYKFIMSNTNSDLLSKPNVTTISGKEALVDLTDEVPYKQLVKIDESGDVSTQEYEFKQVGISLRVTPVVTENEYISMKVKPEISEVTGFTDDNIPYTSRRSVETNVIVKNGETLAIGGLVRETELETVTKIPLLGDIPLLGHLFRSTSKQKQKKNLVVFLTPKIVKVRELSENLTLVQGKGVKERRFVEKTKSGVSKIEAQTNAPQSSSTEEVLENLSDSERYGIKEELQKIQKQQLIDDLLK